MTVRRAGLGAIGLGSLGVAIVGATGAWAAGPVIQARLPNGFTVVVQENPAAPVVAMTLFVRVGSRHDTAETSGLTALLGRTLLKGTRSRTALELAQAAEDAGGALESATDQEYSELRARGLARAWRTLLALLHEVATAPTLAVEEVERERATLLAQIRGLEDQPFQVANRLLNRALYGLHPFGLPTAGELATVRRLRREELWRHFETFYRPERMVLAVSGQLAAAETVEAVTRVFGGLERGPGGPSVVPPPTERVAPRGGEARATQQAQLLVGFLAPPAAQADYAPLKVLNAVLGGGMSSRLFRALRDEAGLAYAVGSFYPTRGETSRLVVHIGTAPANVGRAEADITRQLARLRDEPVTEDELERAKALVTGSFALDLRTNARQSFYLGFFELIGLGYGYVGRYPGAIEAVTAADLQRVARRYLVEPAVVTVGPS